jgi:two-component system sensor histidine kinase KdpD
MIRLKPSQVRRFAGQIAAGSLCIALITIICLPFHLDFAIPSLLFLIVVVLQSLWSGFASSAVVSAIAVTSLTYFFVPPVFQWRIDDPRDVMALIAYWITSQVMTRLASNARHQAQIAEQRRGEVESLYEVASRLFALAPDAETGAHSAQIIREVFGFRAVCLFDATTNTLHSEGASQDDLSRRTADACIGGKDHQDRRKRLYVRCLYSKEGIEGAIGFEGGFDREAVPLALSVLAATAIERANSFRSAGKAAADAHAEMLRSAILDAFAHEFKTPLAIILAAAGGLREAASLRDGQTEMTDIIEDQTVRLSRLTTRLLRIARLDREEVVPAMEPTGLNALLSRLVDRWAGQCERRISAMLGDRLAVVMADPELLGLALTQLLDNACKYSFPGSEVIVELRVNGDSADIHVSNWGSTIRPEDRERIFERFYRSPDTDHATPGSGLGLYVARKIIRAHGGDLDLIPRTDTATFQIRLPVASHEQPKNNEDHQSTGSRR